MAQARKTGPGLKAQARKTGPTASGSGTEGTSSAMVREKKKIRPATSHRRIWLAALSLACVALLAGGGWWFFTNRSAESATRLDLGRPTGGVGPDGMNLLVITLDTTRADRIGAYGYQGVETPTIDRLAREGVLFEHTMAAAPLTCPAHCSIFTSKFPPDHGVRDNGGFFLSPKQLTLATYLKRRGFQTGAVVAAFVLDRKWGLNQGFDTYVDDFDLSEMRRGFGMGEIQRPGNEVVDRALPWLEKVKGQRFFAWLHFYDPHAPYEPPEPFKTRYEEHPYLGEIAFMDSQIGARDRLPRAQRAPGEDGDRGDRRPRREPRPARRGHARLLRLREPRTRVPFIIRAPFEQAPGPPRGRPGPLGGPDADRARPDGHPAARRDRGRQPRAADDRRPQHDGPRRVRRGALSAASLRVERAARVARGPLQGDRRAAARALRPRARSARDDEPLRRAPDGGRRDDRPAARASRGTRRRDDSVVEAGAGGRPRGARPAGRARLRRVVRRHDVGAEDRSRRPEGQDRPVQPHERCARNRA